MTHTMQTRVLYWIKACRPQTLWVAVCPILMAGAISITQNTVHITSLVMALLCSILIQIGTNMANDYFDFKKGADTKDRIGPTRMTQSGFISPYAMKTGFIIIFILAFLSGLYLVYRGGWPILIIGVTAIAMGILYTATPFSLAYTGTADGVAFLFFGPIAVAGTYYLQSFTWDLNAILFGSCLGCFATAILTVNNIRDNKQDALANKQTLTVRFGRAFSEWEYTVMTSTPILLGCSWIYIIQSHFYSLSICLLIPSIVQINRQIRIQTEDKLNPYLGKTARIMVAYTLLFSIGYLL